jgi:alkanesulfonate monooxygenase SsuD/methylene tetrahydromethanopterin reductase-like flavin-dependent oxidoreductase (luciferase family)
MNMKFGLDLPTTGVYADARVLADLAIEAEEAGWDGFFIWDVLFSSNQTAFLLEGSSTVVILKTGCRGASSSKASRGESFVTSK